MIWKSLKEEWPYTNDEIWLRWTPDGINWREEIVHENNINSIECIDVPHWRPLDPPAWMTTEQKDRFDGTRGDWITRVNEVQQGMDG